MRCCLAMLLFAPFVLLKPHSPSLCSAGRSPAVASLLSIALTSPFPFPFPFSSPFPVPFPSPFPFPFLRRAPAHLSPTRCSAYQTRCSLTSLTSLADTLLTDIARISRRHVAQHIVGGLQPAVVVGSVSSALRLSAFVSPFAFVLSLPSLSHTLTNAQNVMSL